MTQDHTEDAHSEVRKADAKTLEDQVKGSKKRFVKFAPNGGPAFSQAGKNRMINRMKR
jgi:hypothetical protein